MRTGSRLGAYGLGVVAVFGLAAAAGAGLGPIHVGASLNHASMSVPAAGAARIAGLSGMAVAADGYRLVPGVSSVGAGAASSYTFRIARIDGSSLTGFDQLRERPLHLIVLSRNLVDYLHVHPSMDGDGTWSVELPALRPGSYRVYADFKPVGADEVTLGADLQIAGLVPAADLPVVSTTDVIDGYQVTLHGDEAVGSSTIEFDVARNGEAIVTDPYLGAAGHLVVIRVGDLGYLHVHPLDGADGAVRFAAEFPTPGAYRLFFDFANGGGVHTASFTVDVLVDDPFGSASVDTMPVHEGK